jgi:RNA polymerase sigma-70 factor (ECF subfamily)
LDTEKHSTLSDQELLERYYQSHDNEWLGLLLQRYLLLLFGVCMNYLKKEEESKDAVQQICLKAITYMSSQRVTYFKSWIYMVAKNHCLMQLRGQKEHMTKVLDESTQSTEADQDDLGAALEKEVLLELMDASLNELNDEQKRCLTLFYLEHRSYQEIAEQAGLTLLQVKSHIQNGKRNLRIAIEKKLTQKRP